MATFFLVILAVSLFLNLLSLFLFKVLPFSVREKRLCGKKIEDIVSGTMLVTAFCVMILFSVIAIGLIFSIF